MQVPERIFEKRREKKKEERKGGKKEREKGGRERRREERRFNHNLKAQDKHGYRYNVGTVCESPLLCFSYKSYLCVLRFAGHHIIIHEYIICYVIPCDALPYKIN